jgi:hypothetical protein
MYNFAFWPACEPSCSSPMDTSNAPLMSLIFVVFIFLAIIAFFLLNITQETKDKIRPKNLIDLIAKLPLLFLTIILIFILGVISYVLAILLFLSLGF